jgi:hypothetical protein
MHDVTRVVQEISADPAAPPGIKPGIKMPV